jgi:hypothetical protein
MEQAALIGLNLYPVYVPEAGDGIKLKLQKVVVGKPQTGNKRGKMAFPYLQQLLVHPFDFSSVGEQAFDYKKGEAYGCYEDYYYKKKPSAYGSSPGCLHAD